MDRVLISALSFVLGYEEAQEGDDSEGSSSEDDASTPNPIVVLRREDVYKVPCRAYAFMITK